MSERKLTGLENELMGFISKKPIRTYVLRELTGLVTYAEDDKEVALALHQLVTDGLLSRSAASRYELVVDNVKALPKTVTRATQLVVDNVKALPKTVTRATQDEQVAYVPYRIVDVPAVKSGGVDIDKHFIRRAAHVNADVALPLVGQEIIIAEGGELRIVLDAGVLVLPVSRVSFVAGGK